MNVEKTISARLDQMHRPRSKTLTAMSFIVAAVVCLALGFIANKGIANVAHEVARASAAGE